MEYIPTELNLTEEMKGASFGDKRLSKRFLRIIETCAKKPTASFPQLEPDRSQLEAIYRFMNNENVNPDNILEPHYLNTAKRCNEAKRIIIAHDSSDFVYRGEHKPEDIGYLKGSNRGFAAHLSLAMNPQMHCFPLGVLHAEFLNRTGPKKGKRTGKQLMEAKDNEALKWNRAIKASSEKLDNDTTIIHVADREADSYNIFQQIMRQKDHFVIRANHNRTLFTKNKNSKRSQPKNLFQKGDITSARFTREVQLSRRKKPQTSRAQKSHPRRDPRKIVLEVKAVKVRLARPAYRKKGASSLSLSFVLVQEVNPPQGEAAIEWKLLSTLPISTNEEIGFILDCYCHRWLIEEYFKAIKTGCSYKTRQQHSYHALVNTLSVFMPIAWRLLALRSFGRSHPDLPSSLLFSQLECEVLDALGPEPLPKNATLKEISFCIARLGGYIRSKSPPGWITLARGMESLALFLLGWKAARGLM